jgi:hypothetical protein
MECAGRPQWGDGYGLQCLPPGCHFYNCTFELPNPQLDHHFLEGRVYRFPHAHRYERRGGPHVLLLRDRIGEYRRERTIQYLDTYYSTVALANLIPA